MHQSGWQPVARAESGRGDDYRVTGNPVERGEERDGELQRDYGTAGTANAEGCGLSEQQLGRDDHRRFVHERNADSAAGRPDRADEHLHILAADDQRERDSDLLTAANWARIGQGRIESAPVCYIGEPGVNRDR